MRLSIRRKVAARCSGFFQDFRQYPVFPYRHTPSGSHASDPKLNCSPCGQPFRNVSSGSKILITNLITAHGIRRTPLIYSGRDTAPLTNVDGLPQNDGRLDGGLSTVGCRNDVGWMSVCCRITAGLPVGYRRTVTGLPPAAAPCVIAATEDSCPSGGHRCSTLPGKMAGPIWRIVKSGGVVAGPRFPLDEAKVQLRTPAATR